MRNYILICPNCGKMYKIVDIQEGRNGQIYITDFGDRFECDMEGYYGCMCCHQPYQINTIMMTEDWVADLVFTTRGN